MPGIKENVEPRDVVAVALTHTGHNLAREPLPPAWRPWVASHYDDADAVLTALRDAGFYICRRKVEDHPVYPRTIYVPVEATS